MKTKPSIGLVAALLMAGTAIGEPTVLTSAQAELMGRVEDFFMSNFKDLTSRKSLEWGAVETDADGSRSIRYKYEARIWDKDTMVVDQVFTFDPSGKFISAKDVFAGGEDEQDVRTLAEEFVGFFCIDGGTPLSRLQEMLADDFGHVESNGKVIHGKENATRFISDAVAHFRNGFDSFEETPDVLFSTVWGDAAVVVVKLDMRGSGKMGGPGVMLQWRPLCSAARTDRGS